MTQPSGFEGGNSQLVCKLHKALYGLKQAPRAWFDKFRLALVELGFGESKADSSLFYKFVKGCTIFILIYVDDIILTGDNEKEIAQLVLNLNQKFALKDLGVLNYFLGIEVQHMAGGIHLSQHKYILDLLKRAGMLTAKPFPSPIVTSAASQLSIYKGNPIDNVTEYWSIVGALQYATITRPDIAYAVNKVCQFMQAPMDEHWKAVKRILRYLKGTSKAGLMFTKEEGSTGT
ncbi:hypothetical protein ACOSQ2_012591 [Xanthoceras sorbifolium]